MKIRVLTRDKKEAWLQPATIDFVDADEERKGCKLVGIRFDSGACTAVPLKNEIAKDLEKGKPIWGVVMHNCMEHTLALIYDNGVTRWPDKREKLDVSLWYFEPRKHYLPICSRGFFAGELRKMGVKE